MRAIILAGGKGTRLAPYNTVFPKPMVPLGDRPILDIVLHQLEFYGFTDIVISVGYLGGLIEAYFTSSWSPRGKAKISFVRESQPLGTVGALALVPELTDSVLVLNGDILTTLNLARFFSFHKENRGMLTIATHRRHVKIDLGVLDVSSDRRVHGMQEKPTLVYPVSMGIYAYEPAVLRYIPPDQYLDFPDVVNLMLRDGEPIFSYPCDDYWLDLGSHLDYQKAQDDFEVMKSSLLPQ